MKYLQLVWAALLRHKARTLFTLLSVAAAFLLERFNVNRLNEPPAPLLDYNFPFPNLNLASVADGN